jgi:hypothetical protein
MKLITGGVKHHLCAADQPPGESITTLCGCVLTRTHSWKRIRGLEGDECAHCSDLAFGGSAAIPARLASQVAS